ncbi:MAG: flagellar hook-length control protein FliK [Magnetococcales bacterium]|nr:flagellar hook-length control protein FliK [Magnetococcales bacterium]
MTPFNMPMANPNPTLPAAAAMDRGAALERNDQSPGGERFEDVLRAADGRETPRPAADEGESTASSGAARSARGGGRARTTGEGNVQNTDEGTGTSRDPALATATPGQAQENPPVGELGSLQIQLLAAQNAGQGPASEAQLWTELLGGMPEGEALEQLLVETLGSRQGGGPMGRVNGLEVVGAGLVSGAGGGMASRNDGSDPLMKGLEAGNPLQTASQRAANDQSSVPRLTLSADGPDFAQELADRIGRLRMVSRPGQPDQMRVVLQPKELGELHVRLQLDGDNRINVQITAETEAAREMLTRQLSQLRQAFERQDLAFGQVTVQVGPDQSQRQDAGGFGDGEGDHGFRGSRGGRQAETAPVGSLSSAPRGSVGDGRVNLFA